MNNDVSSKVELGLPVYMSPYTGMPIKSSDPTPSTSSDPRSPISLTFYPQPLFNSPRSANRPPPPASSSTKVVDQSETRPSNFVTGTKRLSSKILDTRRLSLAFDSVLDTWATFMQTATSLILDEECEDVAVQARRRSRHHSTPGLEKCDDLEQGVVRGPEGQVQGWLD